VVVVVVAVAVHASSLFQKSSNSIFSVFFPLPLLLSKIIYLLHPAQPLLCGLLFCLCAPSVVVVLVVVTTTLGYMVAR